MRLQAWFLLLAGSFAFTPLAGASVVVQNVGYDASFGILVEGSLVAFRTLEARSGMMDLNGDLDANDGVLQILDASTGVLFNTGFDASGGMDLDSGIVGFRVRETSQGGQDLNGDGDVSDIVQFVYSSATGAVTNLGLASLKFDVGGGIVAFTVGESSQGGVDLNSDGDTGDVVLHVFDPATGTLTNLGIDGVSGFVAGAAGVAVAVSEVRQFGADLNGDGDTSDNVLHFFDRATGTTHNLARAVSPSDFTVEGGLVVFRVKESDQGGSDHNGDGDTADAVLHVYDALGGTTVNTGFASFAFGATPSAVAFTVHEPAQGADLNGDGDTADYVMHLYDAAAESTQNVGYAVAGFDLDGSYLAFAVDEAAHGAADFNGDGDHLDVVLHLKEVAGPTLNLQTDASLGFKLDDDTLLAFGAHESAQGVDLNGDSDLNDYVLHVFDITSDTLVNVAVDPSGGFQTFQLDGTYVSLGVQEAAQGETDLNGDGDTSDIVLHLFDATQGTTENVGLDVGLGHMVEDGRIIFGVPESRQGNTDLNGDGDTGDLILHIATVDPSSEPATPSAALDALVADLDALGLGRGLTRSRRVKLEQARRALESGDACCTIAILRTFMRKIEAQSGKKIATADADALLDAARALIDMLESGGHATRPSRRPGPTEPRNAYR